MIECHKCGGPGHVARDCQWEAEAEGRPPWCGNCDRDTRLIDHGTFMQRCHQCWAWPARKTRFHQLLPQHKLCGGCRNIVYEWDNRPCGDHRPLGISVTGHRLHRPASPATAAIAAPARQDLKDHHHDT